MKRSEIEEIDIELAKNGLWVNYYEIKNIDKRRVMAEIFNQSETGSKLVFCCPVNKMPSEFTMNRYFGEFKSEIWDKIIKTFGSFK
jgi:hypothetical protein